ncbi:hypothetical protein COCCU_13625 [Corynebacterium occultum]|uniref:Uncharacterized protein n=2 Tax=Corynebacterium occultum TaxID=2675219 RepID=A0A6B8WBD4_9CORY|nr:hypothetical protein COCCU_13625 [Corynebacterium occultum]
MIITMASVFIGFLCTGGAFAAFMYKKSKVLITALLIIALLLVTVVPVTIAVTVATSPG